MCAIVCRPRSSQRFKSKPRSTYTATNRQIASVERCRHNATCEGGRERRPSASPKAGDQAGIARGVRSKHLGRISDSPDFASPLRAKPKLLTALRSAAAFSGRGSQCREPSLPDFARPDKLVRTDQEGKRIGQRPDSKSGAGKPVGGSSPLPSAWRKFFDNLTIRTLIS